MVNYNTKTTVKISLMEGNVMLTTNIKIPNENFKFLEKEEHNHFNGNCVKHNYFKITKKQDKYKLREHILNILQHTFSSHFKDKTLNVTIQYNSVMFNALAITNEA